MYMSAHHVCVQNPEEGVTSLGTGATDSYETL